MGNHYEVDIIFQDIEHQQPIVSLCCKIRSKSPGNISGESWFHKIQCNQNNWRKNRLFLSNILLKMQYLNGSSCVCDEQAAIIACNDCCNSPICQRYDYNIHSMHPLHDRKSYENGYSASLSHNELLNGNLETFCKFCFFDLKI